MCFMKATFSNFHFVSPIFNIKKILEKIFSNCKFVKTSLFI